MTWTVSDDEAERAVIGGILVHPRTFADCAGEVQAGDFYQPANREIWTAMAALDHRKLPIDAVSVWSQVLAMGSAELIASLGGSDYLRQLMGDVVTVDNQAYHSRCVSRLGERRRFAAELATLTAAARDQGTDSESFFDSVEARLLGLLQQRKSVVTLVGVKPGIRAVTQAIEERQARRKENRPAAGIRIGIEGFDTLSAGLRPGQLMVIAARPSVGKSALMGNVVAHVAKTQGPALVFSLEMTAEELFERMIAADGVNSDRMRVGKLEGSDWSLLTRAAGEIIEAGNVWVDDSGTLSISELRSRARRWRANEGKGVEALVCVDYLQLVKGVTAKGDKREQEVAEVSRGLKSLAKELQCPIIALAQLNRQSEARADRRPTLADLRESGQIEQDADIVAFLYREDIVNANCPEYLRNTAELILGKGRGMPIGTTHLTYEPQHVRFRQMASGHREHIKQQSEQQTRPRLAR